MLQKHQLFGSNKLDLNNSNGAKSENTVNQIPTLLEKGLFAFQKFTIMRIISSNVGRVVPCMRICAIWNGFVAYLLSMSCWRTAVEEGVESSWEFGCDQSPTLVPLSRETRTELFESTGLTLQSQVNSERSAFLAFGHSGLLIGTFETYSFKSSRYPVINPSSKLRGGCSFFWANVHLLRGMEWSWVWVFLYLLNHRSIDTSIVLCACNIFPGQSSWRLFFWMVSVWTCC